MRNLIFFTAMLLAATAFGQPQQPTYAKFKVSAVHDGDTFTGTFVADTSKAKYTVRPVGYDCPEIRSNLILVSQPYGRIAGDTLRKLIKGKVILLDTTAIKAANHRDKYGRLLAEAYFSDSSSVALMMVTNGLAWAAQTADRRIPKMNYIIRNAHRLARDSGKGLWAGYYDDNGKKRYPEAPWTWRKKFGL